MFYHPNITDTFNLDKEESRHLARVLRVGIGSEVLFTDGCGGKYRCRVIDNNPKRVGLNVLEKTFEKAPEPKIEIAIAPTKLNDRIEWFLEKCTEIGISRISPILCKHSERKVIKTERLSKIIVSAMKQSLNAHLPHLDELIPFKDFVTQPFEGKKYICHLAEKPVLLKDIYTKGENARVLIGPEGDFSEEEILLANENGFETVSLGNTRLRTETAGVVACHTLNLLNL